MKYFPEIIRILENFRERRTETVDTDFRGQTDNKEFLLYDGIRSGIFPNDNEASEALYESPLTDTRYSSTKNRLKVRMLNSLFHLNLRRAGFSESAQAFYLTHRSIFIVDVLMGLGAFNVAKNIAEKNLHLAEKFALTDVALAMVIALRRQASNMGRAKEFDHYNQLVNQLSRSYRDELLSNEYTDRIAMIFRRQGSGHSKFAALFEAYEAELRGLLNETSTYNFRLNYYRIVVRARQAAGHTAEVIEGARQGIAFLESFPKLLQKERVADFWLYQLNSYRGTQNFDAAHEASEHCAELYNKGSNGWFSFMESDYFLLMNTLRFEEANALYSEVTTHARFDAQGEILHERFEVYKFFLHIALKTLPDYTPPEKPLRFNFDAMVRRADELKHDKPGMNMVMRFAQVLHLFDQHNYDPIDDLMEPIQNYRTRYIRASSTEQSTIFFRLLKIMVKYSYQYKECLKYGAKLHTRLKTEKFETVDPDQEIQILPYAWLWDWMLEQMKERSLGKR
jgi:hypothetical protein